MGRGTARSPVDGRGARPGARAATTKHATALFIGQSSIAESPMLMREGQS